MNEQEDVHGYCMSLVDLYSGESSAWDPLELGARVLSVFMTTLSKHLSISDVFFLWWVLYQLFETPVDVRFGADQTVFVW